MSCYLGIDVGTGSARAGIFDAQGTLLGYGSQTLRINRPQIDFVEQSSQQIWTAVCDAVRIAIETANIAGSTISGIGFDATCSLVISDASGDPVSVSPSEEDDWNVMVWMDHRAVDEADAINATQHEILARTGGRISPEMQLPKLLWIKKHLGGSWSAARHFHDLPDWLVHKATATEARSMCSLVCKWTYLGEKGQAGEGWDRSFFRLIGLGDLVDEGFNRIGTEVLEAGSSAGSLSEQAAKELGLTPGIAVAAAAIDAYAGALGTLGIGAANLEAMTSRMALVGGTSTCHLTVGEKPRFVSGIWGPYHGALLPGYWANEGGQSVSGALIDHVLASHAAFTNLNAEAEKMGKNLHDVLADRLREMAGDAPLEELTSDLQVVPDFHGNRSPLADPLRKGVVAGLSMEQGPEALARLYLATIQALAYGTRHILDAFAEQGASFDTIVMSGGLARNTLYRQAHADVCDCQVVSTEHSEAVLLGAAMLGAVASEAFANLPSAMLRMSGQQVVTQPSGGTAHEKKYRVFRRMQDDFDAWRKIIEG